MLSGRVNFKNPSLFSWPPFPSQITNENSRTQRYSCWTSSTVDKCSVLRFILLKNAKEGIFLWAVDQAYGLRSWGRGFQSQHFWLPQHNWTVRHGLAGEVLERKSFEWGSDRVICTNLVWTRLRCSRTVIVGALSWKRSELVYSFAYSFKHKMVRKCFGLLWYTCCGLRENIYQGEEYRTECVCYWN